MKKLLVFILCITMMAGTLTGCGSAVFAAVDSVAEPVAAEETAAAGIQAIPAGAAENMTDLAFCVCYWLILEQGNVEGPVSLASYSPAVSDTFNFWRILSIYNGYENYKTNYAGGYDFIMTYDEVKVLGYALFDRYDGEIPAYDNGGFIGIPQATAGEIPGTVNLAAGDFCDVAVSMEACNVNEDGSADVIIYAGFDEVTYQRYSVHMIPNYQAGETLAAPYYYTIESVSLFENGIA